MKTIPDLACPNNQCPDYSQLAKGNIVRFGSYSVPHVISRKEKNNRSEITSIQVQRFKCKTCGTTFSKRRNSIFYRCHATDDKILSAISRFAHRRSFPRRYCLKSLADMFDVNPKTARAWFQRMAENWETTAERLRKEYYIGETQLNTTIRSYLERRTKIKIASSKLSTDEEDKQNNDSS
ncbi:MAG: hypothetical protein QME68_08235 [Elusimicrobiota bacterium]|nr:hypothetical protein [Elusimicrobiota bacterium]